MEPQTPPNNGTAAQSTSAQGVRTALASRADASGKIIVEDLVEASILMLFFIQRLGKASSADILEKIGEIGAEIDEHLAEQAVEALRGRGLVSYASGRRKGGTVHKMWKVKRVIWSAPPEIARIDVLLEALVKTPEAEALIDVLNATEAEGDGKAKAGRELVITKYVDVLVTFQTIDLLLGSQPESQQLDKLLKGGSGKVIENTQLRFWRWPDGDLMIPSDVVRGWVRTGLRTCKPKAFSDSMAGYISAGPAKIRPSKDLEQIALPVIDPRTREGKGLTTYEALQIGEKFTILFSIPTKGFMPAEDFVDWLMMYGPKPVRGLSPARGGRFGKVEVVGYKILDTPQETFEAVKAGLSEEGRAFYEARLRRAKPAEG